MLVSANLSGDTIKWTDVVFEGISTLADRLVGAPLPPPADCPPPSYLPSVEAVPEEVFDREESEVVKPRSGSFRTKTMADLLASQGDIDGALEIYRELVHSSVSDERRTELEGRIAELEGRQGDVEAPCQEDAFSAHAKNRLISTLETLASRFEARVQN